MYQIYAKAVGEDIYNVFQNREREIIHASDYYTTWRLDGIGVTRAIDDNILTPPFFVVDFDFYFITNYEVTKYYTKAQDGKIRFWEYDYKRNFPICCRPFLQLYCSNREELIIAEKIVCDEYSVGRSIFVHHPILPNDMLSFKLVSNTGTGVERIDLIKRIYTKKIYFQQFNIPWFIDRYNKQEIDQELELQQYSVEHIMALFNLSSSCKRYLDLILANNDTEINHIKEKLVSINSGKIELLELLGIPNSMWNIKDVKRISNYIHKDNFSIKQAIDKIIKEDEKRRQAELEMERIKKEKELAQQSDPRQYEDYDDYDDYSKEYRGQVSVSRIIGNTVSSYIANRSVVNAINRQTQVMEQQEKEKRRQQDDERRRRAYESQREWNRVAAINKERRRKGQPELPLPERHYW